MILRLFLSFIISILLGVVLLFLVYLLPVEKMHKNTLNDFLSHNQKVDYIEALMLNTAVYQGGEVSSVALKQALLNSHYADKEHYKIAEEENLKTVLFDKQAPDGFDFVYGRYWNGYLVVLKPLLHLYGYNVIYQINLGLIIFLLVSIFMIMRIRLESFLFSYVFLLSFSILNFSNITTFLSHMAIPLITLFAMLLLLTVKPILKNKEYLNLFFMFIGILTSYFDLFTFPLVTLGFPLITYVLLNDKIEAKKHFKDVLVASICWAGGYFGFWFAKWVVATPITNFDFYKDGFENVLVRIASKVEFSRFNYIDILSGVWRYLLEYKIAISFVFITIMVYKVLKRESFCFNNGKSLLLFAIACYPFLWYLVVQNHSYLHSFFTYKILAISVYALLSILILKKTN